MANEDRDRIIERIRPIGSPSRKVAMTGTVYLIHFLTPYKHAKHYLGYCNKEEEKLGQRLARHMAGRGARLMAVIIAAGIGWKVARTWRGDRHLERRLKNRGGATRLCPLCRGGSYDVPIPPRVAV